MLSNKLAFAALAVTCIAAAAGGGYLASRQNAVPAPVAATSAPPSPAPLTPVGPAERPVQETEGVIGDAAQKAAPAASQPGPAQPPGQRPARRAEAAARPQKNDRGAAARHEPPPTLTSSWPSSANTQPAVSAPAVPAPSAEARPARADEHPQEPADPPQKTFEELVVSADSVIGLQNETRVTTETARVEDRVEARVTRDVKVGDRVAIVESRPLSRRKRWVVTRVVEKAKEI
jgi:small subunit ribosomal protein S17